MKEIVKINLENEMDLILAHKRSMKLAELCGHSNLTQTSFATAISEIGRCVIGNNTYHPSLVLSINPLKNNRKELIASIKVESDFEIKFADAIKYAKRLFSNLRIVTENNISTVKFIQDISYSGLINDLRIEAFINYFKKELPLSPYDELRRKNIQLLEFADKLRESENQYRVLTETLPLMMFTTNAGGHLVFVNKWLKDFFKLADISDDKHHWQSLLHISNDSKLKNDWQFALVNQTTFSTQAKFESKKTKEVLWHLISLIPIKNENNKILSWKGFFVDIHAQKLIEETLKNNEELKKTQKQLLTNQLDLEEKISELNKSNHDLEQFAYIASHDLQEPLRKIRNFSELLERNANDEIKRKVYLEKIDHASERMISLIKAVLNYSRLTKAEKTFESVSLQEIVDGIRSDMELLIDEKKAKFIYSSLPIVNGIKLQLHQLLYNLINNALKFNYSNPTIKIGSRILELQEIREDNRLFPESKYIELSIKDNGIGFDEKYSKQIFTIFKRLNTVRSFEGTGIGLALVKKIVENHHGFISVSSEVGKGTEFKILLPVE